MGFVQFYLAQISNRRLDYSQTNTTSAVRMGAKDGVFIDTTGTTWDIGATNRYSAWLNRQIKKLAVARFEKAYVLPDANRHWQSGGIFGPFCKTIKTHSDSYRSI